ncbi:hypothetical protein PC128_g26803 [Phytophthora cactorum]|nr:hypothetical protein PC120_g24943 [Phytophthora cactorum]KAG3129888.1 hypothetical protein PC128_g26803 [Phytophthora cactorum]KAG4038884.1 hypothetical protein PC123_g25558 [Phytophthora cactorum]
MWEKLWRHIELYVKPEIVSLAKAKGHEVGSLVWSPFSQDNHPLKVRHARHETVRPGC